MLCMSLQSLLVFVAFTQHYIQYTVLCIEGLSLLQEGRLQYCTAFCLVWGSLSGTCQLQGWFQARHTANHQFLKIKGTQQPGNSYRFMGTKLHPPHPNQDCLPTYCTHLDLKNAFQCLKNGSLWSCVSIGRLSLWHSWLIWAKRLANSEELALNAGVPTAPNLLESKCSYLAAILSVKELNSLWACSTVSWLTGMV